MAKSKTDNLDFSKMMFRVHEVKQGTDLCHRFQALAVHDEFQKYEDKDRNYAIRYVNYAYDPQSPLVRYIHDLKERRAKAAQLAGYTSKPRIIQLIEGTDANINKMVKCFLTKVHSNRKYRLKCNLEEQFEIMMDNIAAPIDESTKNNPDKLQRAHKLKYENGEASEGLIKRIEELEKEIYPDYDEVRGIISTEKEASIFASGAAERLADLHAEATEAA